MRLCEIVMAGSPVQEGVSWQRADSSWTWAWVPVWSQIEVDIGIVTACLPCLSPLLRLAWSEVGVKSRTMTPSMVTLPKYSGSWGSVDTVTGEVEKVDEKVEIEDVGLSEKQLPALPEYVEKEVAVKESSYYEDASDEEEAREGDRKNEAPSRRVDYNRRPS